MKHIHPSGCNPWNHQRRSKGDLTPPKTWTKVPSKKLERKNHRFPSTVFQGTFLSFSGWAIHQQFWKKTVRPLDPSENSPPRVFSFHPRVALVVSKIVALIGFFWGRTSWLLKARRKGRKPPQQMKECPLKRDHRKHVSSYNLSFQGGNNKFHPWNLT